MLEQEKATDRTHSARSALDQLNEQISRCVEGGQISRAADLVMDVCSHIREGWGDSDPALGTHLYMAGALYRKVGDLSKAESALRDAVHIQRATSGPKNRDIAKSLHQLGAVYKDQDRLVEASALMTEAVEIWPASQEPIPATFPNDMNYLAHEFQKRGELDVARQLFEQTLAAARSAGDEAVSLAVMHNLSSIYEAMHNYSKAIPLIEHLAGKTRAIRGADDIGLSFALSRLGKAYQATGAAAAAIQCFEDALRIRVKALGKHDPEVGRTLGLLGGAYEAAGRPDMAERYYKEAHEILEEAPPSRRDDGWGTRLKCA
jgi:tetratricopeptide (TPR) repeat protein